MSNQTLGHKVYKAAKRGFLNEIDDLLAAGADVNYIYSPSKKTPIHVATEKGYLDIVQLLLDDSNIEVNAKDGKKETALHKACKNGFTEIVKVLLNHRGIDINARDGEQNTPLLAACEEGHVAVAEILLNTPGIDVNCVNKRGETPILSCLREGHLDLTKIILSHDGVKKTNVPDHFGITPLHIACEEGYKEIALALLDHGSEADLDLQDSLENTPLDLAREKGHSQLADELATHENPKMSSQGERKTHPLHIAIKNGRIDLVKTVLNHRNMSVNITDAKDRTLLHWACEEGNLDIVRELLSHEDIDVNAKDENGVTPFHWACEDGNLELVQILLDHGNVDTNIPCKNGKTPFQCACCGGHMEVVQLLLKHDETNVNSLDKDGMTGINWACNEGHVELVKCLLECEKVDKSSAKNAALTTLHIACMKGNMELVKLLLDRDDVDIHAVDKCGETPLHKACTWGHLTIAKLLVEKGCCINAKGTHDQTPWFVAALNNHSKLSHFMDSMGGQIFVTEKSVQFAIDCNVVQKQWTLIFDEICEHGELVDHGRGSIVEAILTSKDKKRSKLMFDVLFLNKLDTHEIEKLLVSSQQGITVFGLACKNHQVSIIRCILKRTFKPLNVGDPSPFWLAVSAGDMEIVKVLSECSTVDFEKAAPNGTTPLILALAKGMLVEKGSFSDNPFYKIFQYIEIMIEDKHGTKIPVYHQLLSFGCGKLLDKAALKTLKKHIQEDRSNTNTSHFPQIFKRSLSQRGAKVKKSFLIHAIQSDSAETVKLICSMIGKNDPVLQDQDVLDAARSRSVIPIMEQFNLSIPEDQTSPLTELSHEFPVYNEVLHKLDNEKFLKQLRCKSVQGTSINPQDIDELVLKSVCCIPEGGTNDVSTMDLKSCGSNCKNQEQCSAIREVIKELQQLVKKLRERETTMKQLKPRFLLSGSFAEGTIVSSHHRKLDLTLHWEGLEQTPFAVESDATQLLTHDEAKSAVLKDFSAIEGNRIFDNAKFLHFILTEIKETLIEMGYPRESFEQLHCVHELSGERRNSAQIESFQRRNSIQQDSHERRSSIQQSSSTRRRSSIQFDLFKRRSSKQEEPFKAKEGSVYQAKKLAHPFTNYPGNGNRAMLTHNRLGPCIILELSGKVFSINLVPVYPVTGKSSLALFDTVTKTLIEQKPSSWLNHFTQVLTRDAILHDFYQRETRVNPTVVHVALKILHYGPEQSFIIIPGQELQVEDFHNDPKFKRVYIWMKALRDMLRVEATSFSMKKVLLLPDFVQDCRECLSHVDNPDSTEALITMLHAALSHPDLKAEFQEKIDFDQEFWRKSIPLRKL